MVSGPCRILFNHTIWPSFIKCDNKKLFPRFCKNDIRELKFNTSGKCLKPLIPSDNTLAIFEGVEGCGVQCSDPLLTFDEQEQIHAIIAWGAGLSGTINFLTVVRIFFWSIKHFPWLLQSDEIGHWFVTVINRKKRKLGKVFSIYVELLFSGNISHGLAKFEQVSGAGDFLYKFLLHGLVLRMAGTIYGQQRIHSVSKGRYTEDKRAKVTFTNLPECLVFSSKSYFCRSEKFSPSYQAEKKFNSFEKSSFIEIKFSAFFPLQRRNSRLCCCFHCGLLLSHGCHGLVRNFHICLAHELSRTGKNSGQDWQEESLLSSHRLVSANRYDRGCHYSRWNRWQQRDRHLFRWLHQPLRQGLVPAWTAPPGLGFRRIFLGKRQVFFLLLDKEISIREFLSANRMQV